MDKHFRTTSFDNNMPVIMACLSTWYINFHDVQTEGVIPYSQYLNQFATYLQQAIMESNGKYVDRNGNEVTYRTSSVVWGEPGTNSQHAFFQLLHQGTTLIPCDFIGFKESLYQNQEHQDKLMANFFAQTEALMVGKTKEQVLGHKTGIEDSRDTTTPFKVFEGNRPTNTLLIDRLSPRSLGQLIALYEHKIFVQGVIWNIYKTISRWCSRGFVDKSRHRLLWQSDWRGLACRRICRSNRNHETPGANWTSISSRDIERQPIGYGSGTCYATSNRQGQRPVSQTSR